MKGFGTFKMHLFLMPTRQMSTQLENSVFMVFYVKIEICMDQGQTVKGKVGTVSFLSFTGATMVKL